MKHLYLRSLFLPFVLLLFSITAPALHAAEYLADEIRLSFSYDDRFSLRDFTSEFNASQPETLQAKRYLLIGPDVRSSDRGVFEIYIGDMPLFDLIGQSQLRFVNPEYIVNRDFLDTTAVEISGTSFSTYQPVRALAFIHHQQSILLQYHGIDSTVWEAFLAGISQPSFFSDVDSQYAFRTEIDDVSQRGIFLGYENTSTGSMEFRPDQPINRAEYLKVIALAAPGVTKSDVDGFFASEKAGKLKSDKAVFPDVDREAWFAPYVFFAYDQGWVKGYPDGSFRPNQTIILPESAKILLLSRSTFFAPDEEVWFRPFLSYLSEKNVIFGRNEVYRFPFTDSSLQISSPVTRAHTAAFLSRLLWIDEHPGFSAYAREIPEDVLPFRFQALSGAIVYELGHGVSSPDERNAYLFFSSDSARNVPFITVEEFFPEHWTERELTREIMDSTAEPVYLGETRTGIYVYRLNCEASQECFSDSKASALASTFSIRDQDLMRFEDMNLGISFLHSLEIDTTSKREGDTAALQISRPDGSELFILNVLKNSGGAPDFFDGQSPEKARHIGNKDWYQYAIHEENKKQLRLITTSQEGSDTLIAVVINGIDDVSLLDPKVLRMMRTIEFQ